MATGSTNKKENLWYHKFLLDKPITTQAQEFTCFVIIINSTDKTILSATVSIFGVMYMNSCGIIVFLDLIFHRGCQFETLDCRWWSKQGR